MIYLFNEKAGSQRLVIKGEDFKYLIKVRRHTVGDELGFRNKEDIKTLHRYRLNSIEPRSVDFELINSEIVEIKAKKELHIGWCVIDNKSVEKVLASLNEAGVKKITFIYCERSQKNFKPDFKRFERIIEASNQQCGRTELMEFDTCKTLQEFVSQNPDMKVFDFTEKTLGCESDFKTVLIGCEGGFSKNEKEFLEDQEVFRLDTPMILRSESAVLAVASKILL
ncbi:16S rRNA (uracil(1498)-N(3))-methyltransferase [Sulfurimonas paralvinellae]|uniref:Ribosomal RNA small subunit methyltransferase E n=1 Tax=Sulfurimonas paralvinellae TaxID=317658 RepID=A0A7M1B9N3_9BACT|nr:16S rRNA (uracil(1498)-N(3))-methyltransferase [Sulfurimonas paralvinellae]QOP46439.1 16S rRNA (uracil(1498)-N(3))-methyltransferase [Sulfurimonas paralvinellae]